MLASKLVQRQCDHSNVAQDCRIERRNDVQYAGGFVFPAPIEIAHLTWQQDPKQSRQLPSDCAPKQGLLKCERSTYGWPVGRPWRQEKDRAQFRQYAKRRSPGFRCVARERQYHAEQVVGQGRRRRALCVSPKSLRTLLSPRPSAFVFNLISGIGITKWRDLVVECANCVHTLLMVGADLLGQSHRSR